MNGRRMVLLALGFLALSSEATMMTFDFVFHLILFRKSKPGIFNVAAIVSSVLSGITISLLLFLLCRQARYCDGLHRQRSGRSRRHTYLLASLTGIFGLLAAAGSAVLLALLKSEPATLPIITLFSSTFYFVTTALTVWAVSTLSQFAVLIFMVALEWTTGQQPLESYESEKSTSISDTQDRTQGKLTQPHDESNTMPSLHSSAAQIGRPTSSKSKLVQFPHQPFHLKSTEFSHPDMTIASEESFDSWDTSAVDAQSRKAVELACPTLPRFSQSGTLRLEIIPASPTVAGNPSSGYPVDVPLRQTGAKTRSRSFSPATSLTERPRISRTRASTDSGRESHIHPLFRSDSPSPPPAATPGTIVTAAPGAGQVISDCASIRSFNRKRSESLPTSPLTHSQSLDCMTKSRECNEWNKLQLQDAGVYGERTMTPPIPDYIMNCGTKNSLHRLRSTTQRS